MPTQQLPSKWRSEYLASTIATAANIRSAEDTCRRAGIASEISRALIAESGEIMQRAREIAALWPRRPRLPSP